MPFKPFLKKIIPKFVFGIYYLGLAILANIIYGWPSRDLKVIGVTGTNGKTTTCHLIWQILTTAGYKTGLTSSINFKIGDRSWVNDTKQGMQGRFCLQKLLRQMVKAGCQYAVIETTSEGIKQYRHWGILYDIAVFTNLTPEHIESHGSWEKYRAAKGKLFSALKKYKIIAKLSFRNFKKIKHTPSSPLKRGLPDFAQRNNLSNRQIAKLNKKVSVVNLDDKNAEYFLGFNTDEKWGYSLKFSIFNFQFSKNFQFPISNFQFLTAYGLRLTADGVEFKIKIDNHEYHFTTQLLGEFNIYNCFAAMAVGLSQGIDIKIIQKALAQTAPIDGRMEIIYDSKRDISVIVDYAHDPVSLELAYKTIKSQFQAQDKKHKLIAVFGSSGGGRDIAKRPKMGSVASRFADYVIVTNEDPYDDDAMEIINQIAIGLENDPERLLNQNYWKIEDRRQAIQKAVNLSQPGDIIVLTGKGCEKVMIIKGIYYPWDDREVVREILNKQTFTKMQ